MKGSVHLFRTLRRINAIAFLTTCLLLSAAAIFAIITLGRERSVALYRRPFAQLVRGTLTCPLEYQSAWRST
jgi:hypothetical protein